MEPLFTQIDDDRWQPSAWTRGPWSPDHQHFGPPAALLGRAFERTAGGEGKRVARVTFEILHPVPISEVRITTEVVRPGGRIDLLDATMTDPSGKVLVRARAWRMRIGEVDVPATASRVRSMSRPDDAATPATTLFLPEDVPGYHVATQWRFHRGDFMEMGPSAAWCRLLTPVVDGEEPSQLQRVLVAADSGNGISAVAHPRDLLFVNTDLTLHLPRDPVGEWVGLDAETVMEPTGTGLTTSTLHDERGPIGHALQTLFVANH